MIKADSVLVDIRKIVTPKGPAPLLKDKLAELHVMENMAIASKDGFIVWIGPEDELTSNVEVQGNWYSAGGGTVLPGFVDPHTHPVFGGNRTAEFNMRIRGKSYSEIAAAGGGILNTMKATREAEEKDLIADTWERLNTMLTEGITTIEGKSGYGLDTESEIKQLSVIEQVDKVHAIDIVPTFLGAHEYPPEYKNDHEGYIKILIEEMLPAVKESGLAKYCDIFTEEGVYSIEESRRIMRAAKDMGFELKFHADEMTDLGGGKLAAELGAVSADHLMFVSDESIKAMAKSGTAAVLLPGTSFFLMMSNYAPARKLIENGVPVALATDFNPGSSHTQSMQMIITLACLNMKMTIEEAISAATINAAYAIGLGDKAGSIEVGKWADMAIFDFKDYNELVYNWGVNHVERVIKKGSLVYIRQQNFFNTLSGPSSGKFL
ncbi:MAG: imidazolonepropionase [Acidobacteria bacterium]|nr:imidazolonepropionase [Acidobacteriota bacterium]